jgi:hypothetical protein
MIKMTEQQQDQSRADLQALIDENKALKRQVLGTMLDSKFHELYGKSPESAKQLAISELENRVVFDGGELRFETVVGAGEPNPLRHRSSLEDAIRERVLHHGQALELPPTVGDSPKKKDTYSYQGTDYKIISDRPQVDVTASVSSTGGKSIKESELLNTRRWCNQNDVEWRNFTNLIAQGKIKVVPG